MLCDIEMQDTPTVVTDDEKAIERAEDMVGTVKKSMHAWRSPPNLGDQLPVPPESCPMPPHHCFGSDHNERRLPSGPKSTNGDPEEPVEETPTRAQKANQRSEVQSDKSQHG